MLSSKIKAHLTVTGSISALIGFFVLAAIYKDIAAGIFFGTITFLLIASVGFIAYKTYMAAVSDFTQLYDDKLKEGEVIMRDGLAYDPYEQKIKEPKDVFSDFIHEKS